MVFSIAGAQKWKVRLPNQAGASRACRFVTACWFPTDNWNSLKLTYITAPENEAASQTENSSWFTPLWFSGGHLLVYREESCDTQLTRSTKIFPSAICFYLLRCHAFRSKHVFCLGSVSSGHHGPSGLSVHLFLPLKPWWEASKQGKQQTATRSSPMGVYFYAFWGYFDTMMRKYLIERIHGIFETT